MTNSSKIALLLEMLEGAESSIRSAKQLLAEMGVKIGKGNIAKVAEKAGTIKTDEKNQIVIEGVFDGQNMIGPDGKNYSVPANYASKSKLVQGDMLKLTILEDGTFVYKQIGPTEKQRIVGVLSFDEGQYRVLANGKSYKVLLASITYLRAEIGDKVAILIPEQEDTEWAAVDYLMPKIDSEDIEGDFSEDEIE